jgi:HSP20 family protein
MQPPRQTRRPASIARLLSERARASQSEPQGHAGQAQAPDLDSIPGLSGIVETLRGLADGMAQLADRSGQGEQDVEIGGRTAKMVFGYTMRMGLNGAEAEPFGHMPERGTKPDAQAPRQPIVDIYDEGADLVVIAELPGVEATEIECRLDDRSGAQTLHVRTGGSKRWEKAIALPSVCDPASLRQSCRNGILEIRLTRSEGAAP